VCDALGDELPLGEDDAENEEDLGKPLLLPPPSLARIVLLIVIFMPSELCLTIYSEFLLLPPGFAMLLLVKMLGWPPPPPPPLELFLIFITVLPVNDGVGDELCELCELSSVVFCADFDSLSMTALSKPFRFRFWLLLLAAPAPDGEPEAEMRRN
jgi:hypothetical protein